MINKPTLIKGIKLALYLFTLGFIIVISSIALLKYFG